MKTNRPLRVAIIGAGISGLTAAYLLSRKHAITVFEANDYLGGHTNTVEVMTDGGCLPIDTGFIVFNDRTYPNFLKILNELRVGLQPTSMSFSVRDERTGLEYNGTSLNRLFTQRRNMFRPGFHRMLVGILRFNKRAQILLDDSDEEITLGDFLTREGFSKEVIEHYVVPMGSALWSAEPDAMMSFPARYFVRFFHNHGLLGFGQRPNWCVIQNGSREYVRAMSKSFAGHVRLKTAVRSIRRFENGIEVLVDGRSPESFDAVVLACHSDQSLRILADPTIREREILGAIPYQTNSAVLHCDTAMLPKKRRAWGAWNYLIPKQRQTRVAVTYNMNILQGIHSHRQYCVTLNCGEHIDPRTVIQRIEYHHPVFTIPGIVAQRRYDEISGIDRTFYAGAYWGFGFHEDGVNSALSVCTRLGVSL